MYFMEPRRFGFFESALSDTIKIVVSDMHRDQIFDGDARMGHSSNYDHCRQPAAQELH
jgi:hypothetical protein